MNKQPTDEQREEALDKAWGGGFLQWLLRPVQEKIYKTIRESKNVKKVINASRRLGKTHTLSSLAIETGRRTPGGQVHFGFPSQKALKKIVRPIFKDILRTCPARYKPIYIASEQAYYFNDRDSFIHLSGLNQGHADSLRGPKSHRSIVDEAGYVDDLDYAVKDILTPQLLTTGGDLILSSTPPPTPAHDFAEYAHQAKDNGTYSEFDIYQSGYKPEIIEKFKKEAGGENASTWKREYLCQFVIDEELAIIPEFLEDQHALPWERTDLWKFYTCYEAMDIGVRDFTVVLFGYYDFLKAKIFVEDELVMNGPQMTSDLLVRAIRDKEKALFGGKVEGQIRRVADDNNLILIQDLGYLHKLPFTPTTKDNLDAMVNELRVLVSGGRLNVHPRCKHTIGCLKYGVWSGKQNKKREFARSKVYGHYDGLAALVYLVRNVDQTSNPIPRDYELRDSEHFIDVGKKDVAEKGEIMKILGLGRRK